MLDIQGVNLDDELELRRRISAQSPTNIYQLNNPWWDRDDGYTESEHEEDFDDDNIDWEEDTDDYPPDDIVGEFRGQRYGQYLWDGMVWISRDLWIDVDDACSCAETNILTTELVEEEYDKEIDMDTHESLEIAVDKNEMFRLFLEHSMKCHREGEECLVYEIIMD
jgi:hypothetical protein